MEIAQKPVERTKDVIIDEKINFASMLLSNDTLKGLQKCGYHKPSPIQLKAIPLGRCGFDLIVEAKSGTGKTAVFGIIALEMINPKKNSVQVLILAPTREIAVQICEVINGISGEYKDLKTAYFIGGLPLEEDVAKLQSCHVAVGAPGRIKHLIDAGHLKTDSVRLFVLDEADKLMASTFQADINQIYHRLPARKQMMAVSATYPDDLDKFLAKYMLTPTHVSPKTDSPLLLGLKQFVSVVKSNLNATQQMNIKVQELLRLLGKISFTQCLIFTNYQTKAESISNILNQKGWETAYISAAQSQPDRLEVLRKLKDFRCRVLLSTDLTARGIDAVNVDLVVNYEVPNDASTYLHRMGRAGRYGSRGICVTVASGGKELGKLQTILGTIGGRELSVSKLPHDEGFPEDIWGAPCDSFERLHGTVSDNILNVSDIKKSIFDMKNEKLPTTNGESAKESSDNFDAESILKKLANGEPVEAIEPISNDKWETCMDTSHVLEMLTGDSKRKRSSSVEVKLHVEKRPISTYENNISLLNVTKLLLSGEIQDAVQPDVVTNLEEYVGKLKEEDVERVALKMDKIKDTPCDEILSNMDNFVDHKDDNVEHQNKDVEPKNDVLEPEDPSTEDIFKYAYDHSVDAGKPHWMTLLGVAEADLEDVIVEEKVNLLECFEEEEEYDEDEEEFEPEHRNHQHRKKPWTRRQRNTSISQVVENKEAEYKEIVPQGEYYPAGLNAYHEYSSCETFATCFAECGELLLNEALELDNSVEFDGWFERWQRKVDGVRDYVQQNVYYQEMSRYHYYRQN